MNFKIYIFTGIINFSKDWLCIREIWKLEHYTYMVLFLGRAGHLHEVEDMIKMMPCKLDVAVWMALLGACRIHGNVAMGERIVKHILEVDPRNVTRYVLLSNIYATIAKWDMSEKV